MTEGLRPMVPIPISAAKMIADSYGYDQVIILGRRIGEEPEPAGDHLTTWGRPDQHSAVAARIGDFLKRKIMGWPNQISDEDVARLGEIARRYYRGRALVNQDDLLKATREFAEELGITTLPDRRMA